MACDVLPAIDKQICSFERWLIIHLATITEPAHAQLVHRFATWEVLPRLRTRAMTKPITPAGRRFAGEQIKYATSFLGWLATHDRALHTCSQANIDTWHAEHNEHDRNCLRGFLLWGIASKLTGLIGRRAASTTRRAAPLPQRQRMELLGRLLTDPDPPLRSRVAGVIVLLYAQPVSRITRLTVDDVVHDQDQVLLRLGAPPSPVPAPVADLLLRWIDNRDNMNTATNPSSRPVPRPPRRPTNERRPPRRPGQQTRNPHHRRTQCRDPPARPRDASPRGRRRPRLPPRHHRQARRPSRRHLEPIRPR
jgi:hypothetical protein